MSARLLAAEEPFGAPPLDACGGNAGRGSRIDDRIEANNAGELLGRAFSRGPRA